MQRLVAEGPMLAVFGAMIGALLAQLDEFRPQTLPALLQSFGLSLSVIVLFASGMVGARHFHASSRWTLASAGVFVTTAVYLFGPELSIIVANGVAGLDGNGARQLAIKLTVTSYAVLWIVYETLEAFARDSKSA